MRIVLLAPLYPPEIAEPAPYSKELAKRLSKQHSVTVLAYTRLPEKVAGVSILEVHKRDPLLVRLIHFYFALLKASRHADIIYAINGASVELPTILMSLFTKRPYILCVGDIEAHHRAQKSFPLRTLEHSVFVLAESIVEKLPLPRPEILPLDPFPTKAMAEYEQSWDEHLTLLNDFFKHAHA